MTKAILLIMLGTYIYFYVVPHFKERFVYYQIKRVLKKIAKRAEDEEVKNKINEVIDICDNIKYKDYENKL